MKLRPRDLAAERSRAAILDAAETLFADRGYEGASLQEIGAAAGLARTTPAYFFESKEQLYSAVLDRLLEDVAAEVVPAGRLIDKSLRLEQRLEEIVRSFLEFLLGRPAFVKLIQREALRPDGVLGGSRGHLRGVQEGLGAIGAALAEAELNIGPDEIRQLLVSFIALSWFPVATGSLLADFGVDLSNPRSVEGRVRHVARLLQHGMGGLS